MHSEEVEAGRIANRKARAREQAAQLQEEFGPLQPVAAKGVKIASTFWGQSWNRNLERYPIYEHRLPRGRSLLKNGLVLDLRIEPGVIRALVSGEEVFTVQIRIAPLEEERWKRVREECAGKITSLVALLQGKLPESVMETVTRETTGLFPEPEEIRFVCNCLDDADLCEHGAAAAYGVGARLDENPELLFALRQVDQTELLSEGTSNALGLAAGLPLVGLDDLESIFGIELEGD